MSRQVIGMVGALAALFFAAGPSRAADAKAGKALHDAKCVRCHGTEVYTSAGRKLKTLDALGAQVARCADAADAGWSRAQVADVAEYLNGAFYKFKPAK